MQPNLNLASANPTSIINSSNSVTINETNQSVNTSSSSSKSNINGLNSVGSSTNSGINTNSSASIKYDDNYRGIKITNLPSRSQNLNLKENLYDEFVKYGRISMIRIDGEGDKKVCYIAFRHADQAQKAIENLNDRQFLQQNNLKLENIDINSIPQIQHLNGTCNTTTSSVTTNTQLTSSTMNSSNSTLQIDEELDEYCSRATRTLYIGNLDRDVKHCDLREKLDKKYGDIIEIEIKKDNKKQNSNNSSNSYAFIQFSDIKSVIKAMRCLSGKCIGNNLIKLGFGKSKPTRVLWLDGISEQLKDSFLLEYFKSHCDNNVNQVLIDRAKCQALVYFVSIEDAKICSDKIRAKKFYNRRIMVDFASKEFISSRFEHLLDPKHHLIINPNRTPQLIPPSTSLTSSNSANLVVSTSASSLVSNSSSLSTSSNSSTSSNIDNSTKDSTRKTLNSKSRNKITHSSNTKINTNNSSPTNRSRSSSFNKSRTSSVSSRSPSTSSSSSSSQSSNHKIDCSISSNDEDTLTTKLEPNVNNTNEFKNKSTTSLSKLKPKTESRCDESSERRKHRHSSVSSSKHLHRNKSKSKDYFYNHAHYSHRDLQYDLEEELIRGRDEISGRNTTTINGSSHHSHKNYSNPYTSHHYHSSRNSSNLIIAPGDLSLQLQQDSDELYLNNRDGRKRSRLISPSSNSKSQSGNVNSQKLSPSDLSHLLTVSTNSSLMTTITPSTSSSSSKHNYLDSSSPSNLNSKSHYSNTNRHLDDRRRHHSIIEENDLSNSPTRHRGTSIAYGDSKSHRRCGYDYPIISDEYNRNKTSRHQLSSSSTYYTNSHIHQNHRQPKHINSRSNDIDSPNQRSSNLTLNNDNDLHSKHHHPISRHCSSNVFHHNSNYNNNTVNNYSNHMQNIHHDHKSNDYSINNDSPANLKKNKKQVKKHRSSKLDDDAKHKSKKKSKLKTGEINSSYETNSSSSFESESSDDSSLVSSSSISTSSSSISSDSNKKSKKEKKKNIEDDLAPVSSNNSSLNSVNDKQKKKNRKKHSSSSSSSSEKSPTNTNEFSTSSNESRSNSRETLSRRSSNCSSTLSSSNSNNSISSSVSLESPVNDSYKKKNKKKQLKKKDKKTKLKSDHINKKKHKTNDDIRLVKDQVKTAFQKPNYFPNLVSNLEKVLGDNINPQPMDVETPEESIDLTNKQSNESSNFPEAKSESSYNNKRNSITQLKIQTNIEGISCSSTPSAPSTPNNLSNLNEKIHTISESNSFIEKNSNFNLQSTSKQNGNSSQTKSHQFPTNQIIPLDQKENTILKDARFNSITHNNLEYLQFLRSRLEELVLIMPKFEQDSKVNKHLVNKLQSSASNSPSPSSTNKNQLNASKSAVETSINSTSSSTKINLTQTASPVIRSLSTSTIETKKDLPKPKTDDESDVISSSNNNNNRSRKSSLKEDINFKKSDSDLSVATCLQNTNQTSNPKLTTSKDRRSLEERIKILDEMMDKQKKNKPTVTSLICNSDSNNLVKTSLTSQAFKDKFANSPLFNNTIKITNDQTNKSLTGRQSSLDNSPTKQITLSPTTTPTLNKESTVNNFLIAVASPATTNTIQTTTSLAMPTSVQIAEKLGLKIKGSSNSTILTKPVDVPIIHSLGQNSIENTSLDANVIKINNNNYAQASTSAVPSASTSSHSNASSSSSTTVSTTPTHSPTAVKSILKQTTGQSTTLAAQFLPIASVNETDSGAVNHSLDVANSDSKKSFDNKDIKEKFPKIEDFITSVNLKTVNSSNKSELVNTPIPEQNQKQEVKNSFIQSTCNTVSTVTSITTPTTTTPSTPKIFKKQDSAVKLIKETSSKPLSSNNSSNNSNKSTIGPKLAQQSSAINKTSINNSSTNSKIINKHDSNQAKTVEPKIKKDAQQTTESSKTATNSTKIVSVKQSTQSSSLNDKDKEQKIVSVDNKLTSEAKLNKEKQQQAVSKIVRPKSDFKDLYDSEESESEEKPITNQKAIITSSSTSLTKQKINQESTKTIVSTNKDTKTDSIKTVSKKPVVKQESTNSNQLTIKTNKTESNKSDSKQTNTNKTNSDPKPTTIKLTTVKNSSIKLAQTSLPNKCKIIQKQKQTTTIDRAKEESKIEQSRNETETTKQENKSDVTNRTREFKNNKNETDSDTSTLSEYSTNSSMNKKKKTSKQENKNLTKKKEIIKSNIISDDKSNKKSSPNNEKKKSKDNELENSKNSERKKKEKISKVGGVSRELCSLLSSSGMTANFNQSMYDRLKAQPRKLNADNESLDKKKKRRKKKKKMARRLQQQKEERRLKKRHKRLELLNNSDIENDGSDASLFDDESMSSSHKSNQSSISDGSSESSSSSNSSSEDSSSPNSSEQENSKKTDDSTDEKSDSENDTKAEKKYLRKTINHEKNDDSDSISSSDESNRDNNSDSNENILVDVITNKKLKNNKQKHNNQNPKKISKHNSKKKIKSISSDENESSNDDDSHDNDSRNEEDDEQKVKSKNYNNKKLSEENQPKSISSKRRKSLNNESDDCSATKKRNLTSDVTTKVRKREKSNDSLFDSEELNIESKSSQKIQSTQLQLKNQMTNSSIQNKRPRVDSTASSTSSTNSSNKTSDDFSFKKRKLDETTIKLIKPSNSTSKTMTKQLISHQSTENKSKSIIKTSSSSSSKISKNISSNSTKTILDKKEIITTTANKKDSISNNSKIQTKSTNQQSSHPIIKPLNSTSSINKTVSSIKPNMGDVINKTKTNPVNTNVSNPIKKSTSGIPTIKSSMTDSTKSNIKEKKTTNVDKVEDRQTISSSEKLIKKQQNIDNQTTKSALSSSSSSSIGCGLEDEPLTLSTIIKTESKNIQNNLKNKKNQSQNQVKLQEEEDDDVDKAVKIIFEATNKSETNENTSANLCLKDNETETEDDQHKKLDKSIEVKVEDLVSIQSADELLNDSVCKESQIISVLTSIKEEPLVEQTSEVLKSDEENKLLIEHKTEVISKPEQDKQIKDEVKMDDVQIENKEAIVEQEKVIEFVEINPELFKEPNEEKINTTKEEPVVEENENRSQEKTLAEAKINEVDMIEEVFVNVNSEKTFQRDSSNLKNTNNENDSNHNSTHLNEENVAVSVLLDLGGKSLLFETRDNRSTGSTDSSSFNSESFKSSITNIPTDLSKIESTYSLLAASEQQEKINDLATIKSYSSNITPIIQQLPQLIQSKSRTSSTSSRSSFMSQTSKLPHSDDSCIVFNPSQMDLNTQISLSASLNNLAANSESNTIESSIERNIDEKEHELSHINNELKNDLNKSAFDNINTSDIHETNIELSSKEDLIEATPSIIKKTIEIIAHDIQPVVEKSEILEVVETPLVESERTHDQISILPNKNLGNMDMLLEAIMGQNQSENRSEQIEQIQLIKPEVDTNTIKSKMQLETDVFIEPINQNQSQSTTLKKCEFGIDLQPNSIHVNEIEQLESNEIVSQNNMVVQAEPVNLEKENHVQIYFHSNNNSLDNQMEKELKQSEIKELVSNSTSSNTNNNNSNLSTDKEVKSSQTKQQDRLISQQTSLPNFQQMEEVLLKKQTTLPTVASTNALNTSIKSSALFTSPANKIIDSHSSDERMVKMIIEQIAASTYPPLNNFPFNTNIAKNSMNLTASNSLVTPNTNVSITPNLPQTTTNLNLSSNSTNNKSKTSSPTQFIPPQISQKQSTNSSLNYNLPNLITNNNNQNQQQFIHHHQQQQQSKTNQIEAKENSSSQPSIIQTNQQKEYDQHQSQQHNQFLQSNFPSLSSVDALNQYQAAYNKYPLTFLPTPPQFQQHQQQQNHLFSASLNLKSQQSRIPSPSQSPKTTSKQSQQQPTQPQQLQQQQQLTQLQQPQQQFPSSDMSTFFNFSQFTPSILQQQQQQHHQAANFSGQYSENNLMKHLENLFNNQQQQLTPNINSSNIQHQQQKQQLKQQFNAANQQSFKTSTTTTTTTTTPTNVPLLQSNNIHSASNNSNNNQQSNSLTAPKFVSSHKQNKKQLAKEYEQQQQLQQQQMLTKSPSPSPSIFNQFSQFQSSTTPYHPTNPVTPNNNQAAAAAAAYYSAFETLYPNQQRLIGQTGGLTRIPFLMAAATGHLNDLSNPNTQNSNASQSQLLSSKSALPSNQSLEYLNMNQIAMASFNYDRTTQPDLNYYQQQSNQSQMQTQQAPLTFLQSSLNQCSNPYLQQQQQQPLQKVINQPSLQRAESNLNSVDILGASSTTLMDQNFHTGFTEFQDISRILWSGSFMIKNDIATVAMNFVAGNIEISRTCLNQMGNENKNGPIRILQRMRLEPNQLEGVQRKLQTENEHSILIAVPYGTSTYDQMTQTTYLRNGFINYLLEKKAAGIVNVIIPNTTLVVHIFPPCDFTNDILRLRNPDLHMRLADYTYLFIVITTTN